MAVGIPYVATPVGASAEIGEPGVTHLFASSDDEWYKALEMLISNPEPIAAPIAIFGVILVSFAILVVSSRRVRRMEINYTTE